MPVERVVARPSIEEVFFLTSRERIYKAFLRWGKKIYPYDPDRVADEALEQSRTFMKYLKIPSDREVTEYRDAVNNFEEDEVFPF